MEHVEQTVSLPTFVAMALNLPPESALGRAVAEPSTTPPDAFVLEMLRLIEFRIHNLVWQNSGDGRRGFNPPSPVDFPWHTDEAGPDMPDALSWEDIADMTGDDRYRQLAGGAA